MIFYSEQNVYEAAKDRIRYLLDEFYPKYKFVVGFSGGKDSTTVLHLLKEVFDERGIKDRIAVMFLDQELEAPMVVDYVREVMRYDWVEPFWVQSYFREWNSSKGDWFHVWGIDQKWAREKEPDAYTDLDFKVKESFNHVLTCVYETLFGSHYIALGGVRIDESPMRRLGLTRGNVYKDITWGKQQGEAMIFYPIWDWRTRDVWYYIFSNGYSYCKLYNYYFSKKPLSKCRVSSFIHENSIQGLREIKEVSPQFYEKIQQRVENVNATVQSYSMLLDFVKDLPPYFSSWDEYIHYLIDNLIAEPKNAEIMSHSYDNEVSYWSKKFGSWQEGIDYANKQIGLFMVHSILAEDYALSKVRQEAFRLFKYYKENESKVIAANSRGVQ